ncbi:uncharacterized protein Tco025E_08354 [Trypanosoma conorhini]|uniref:Uncharacterized protein n=1 Tax=Trypanosoma conorhini TaxID=83891 RepID=A0A3R7MHK4_9TRYP|nr:uncharacterized protein Tco025E_08354 [Trypanosoma conorhini]RNF02622.1 hypothetical protein Tco025E_08354 [Trypanosoma conorhini]
MNSSDDEWRNPPSLLVQRNVGGRDGEDAMLAARRQAMQRQRDAAALAPISRQQMVQPAAVAPEQLAVKPPAPEKQETGVTEEMLESLRRELDAKTKLLVAAKEKETSLRDRWRALKAQRLAEIAQLDAKLRQQQDAMENVKASAEREVLEAQDAQQQHLNEERDRVAAAIREQYEPQITAMRAELEGLQQQEAKLQEELGVGDTVKDLVHKCVGSALLTLLQRVEDMFAADASTMEAWEDDVQRLVRHEVRSSFAVTTGSEAQREREDCQKLFQESLDFWRKAEEEAREQVLKMDEQLLLDTQSMVHDDLDRLQREELSMEEMYVESREAWASQHQEMLKRELEAAMNRRAAEHEEQRALRHQVHLERMKAVEENHHDMLEKQRWIHEKHMALLREQHTKEEHLAEQRSRVNAAMQADVARATEEFNRVVHAVEALLKRMQEYRATIEDGRAALDGDRRRALEAREETLTMLQDVVTKQSVSVGDEHNSLVATLSKLEAVRRTMEQHLEEERLWVGKQEARYAHGKTEWEQEYRRWKQMVEDEKCNVQERFGRVLAELREATVQLAEEERDAQAEQAAMTSWFRNASDKTEAEVRQLRLREEELKSRHAAMVNLQEEMRQKTEQVEGQWRRLRQERQDLMKDNEALREDEMRLRQTRQYLRLLHEQLEGKRLETARGHEQINALRHELQLSHEAVKNMPKTTPDARQNTSIGLPSASRHVMPTVTQNCNRLPLRVLHELREMLGKKGRHVPFASTVAELPQPEKNLSHAFTAANTSPPRQVTAPQNQRPPREQPRQSRPRYFDPLDSSRDTSTQLYETSNNNFTSLLNLSDTESVRQSPHNSS